MGLHVNRGNIVSRIGRLRRHRLWAICIAVVAIGVAVVGWTRNVKTECQDWCKQYN